jgi:polygalacturonase
VGDGLTVNTEAITRALAAAALKPGSTVVFPAGRWLTGPIALVSGVTLLLDGPQCQLEAMRTMVGWPTMPYKEYPSLPSDKPHKIFRAFIYGYNLTDVAIIGGGIVHGHGDFWWPFGKKVDFQGVAYKLPNLVHLVGCVNVRISGIKFKSSPHFTVRPQYCTDVDIDHIQIENDADSRGTNGVVFDSTQRATLTDSFINTGNKEDAVAIKSGEDEEGRARSIPSRDITVRHVTVHGGHAVSVGSEMSGGVFNITFTDITFDGRHNGFGVGSARIKTQRGRGGVVDGITFQNIHGYHALYALELYEYYTGSENVGQLSPEETPIIRNVVMRNVNIDGVQRVGGVIAGLPEAPIEGLVLENIHLKNVRKGGWECRKFKECTWKGGGCAYGTVTDVTPALPDGCVLPPPTATAG